MWSLVVHVWAGPLALMLHQVTCRVSIGDGIWAHQASHPLTGKHKHSRCQMEWLCFLFVFIYFLFVFVVFEKLYKVCLLFELEISKLYKEESKYCHRPITKVTIVEILVLLLSVLCVCLCVCVCVCIQAYGILARIPSVLYSWRGSALWHILWKSKVLPSVSGNPRES